uniref:Uncharacterized protein n=1 Tax=mine drainage metagenome TaxID=410659 RepID=E6QTY9_9ZZZZ
MVIMITNAVEISIHVVSPLSIGVGAAAGAAAAGVAGAVAAAAGAAAAETAAGGATAGMVLSANTTPFAPRVNNMLNTMSHFFILFSP